MINWHINRLLRQYIHGHHHIGVFPRDLIRYPPRGKCAFVFNTDPHTGRGQHWVAVYIDSKGVGHYFDSYGLPPMEKEFIHFLNTRCKRWVYNDERLQDNGSKACGQFCLYFLIHMSYGWSMDDVVDCLINNEDTQVIDFVKTL